MTWLTRWLGWRVWNGRDIKIGVDPIAGSNSAYSLSEGLKYYLEDYGITSVADAHFNGTNYIS